jgi:tetratricopeptide (TPR) repeat protein
MLQQEGAINPARAINIILQLCDAMKQAHDNGVIHRDLKPSNVIISRDKNGNETAKILDFGIARVFDQISSAHMPLTETGEMLGTPWYMSPEQCFGQMMDLRSDIYQIGCLLFELLTGKRAFDGTTAFEVMYKHVTGLPNMDDVLPEMQKILAKTLDKNPEERYSSVSELSKELAALPLDELTQGKLPAAVAASKFWESESLGQLVWRRTFAAGIDALMIATISAFIILCLASTKLFATWDMTIPMVVHRTQATFGLGLIDSIFPWVSIVTSIVPDRFLSWDSGLRDIFNGIHWLWNNSIAWSPLTVLIVHWLYSAGFECSRLRGTPGKILLGLKVRSTISSKLTFMQTSRRHFAKAITSLLLPGVVRFFNGVLRKGAKSQLLAQVRRPIHDKLSECVVTRAKRRKEPLITAIAVSLLALIAAVPSAPWLACDLQKYDLAIALNHDMLPAYELRANHNVTSGKFKEAIKDLDFVLKKNPAQFRAYDTLAAIYYQMGDFNKAIDVCKTGIEQCKDRDRPALRQDIIEILLGEKKYSEAAAIFNDLSENDVDSILRASVYDQLHDPAASSLHWNLAKNSAASSVRWMDEDNNGKWVHERPESFLNDAIVNDAIGNSARATKSCLRSISDCEGMEKNTLESQKGWSYTDYTHGSAALLRGKQLLRESNEVAANAFFRTAINHYSKYLEKLEKDKGATTLSYVKFHGRALLGRAAAYEKLQMFEQAAKDRAAATKLGVFLDSHFSYPDWHT